MSKWSRGTRCRALVGLCFMPVVVRAQSTCTTWNRATIPPFGINRPGYVSAYFELNYTCSATSPLLQGTNFSGGLNFTSGFGSFNHIVVAIRIDMSRNAIANITRGSFINQYGSHRVDGLVNSSVWFQGTIVHLDLSNNLLTEIRPGTLPRTLTSLNLAGNQITVVQDSAFANWVQLRDLDLSGNQLSMFRDIIFFDLQSDGGFGGTATACGAVNLLTLNLRNNVLRTTRSGTTLQPFARFFQLTSLDLVGNPLVFTAVANSGTRTTSAGVFTGPAVVATSCATGITPSFTSFFDDGTTSCCKLPSAGSTCVVPPVASGGIPRPAVPSVCLPATPAPVTMPPTSGPTSAAPTAAPVAPTAIPTSTPTAPPVTEIQALRNEVAALTQALQLQHAQINALITNSTSVCSRPLCGSGTMPSGGVCLPDCPTLRRRSISCEPFCAPAPSTSPTAATAAPTSPVVIVSSGSTGSDASTVTVAGIAVGVVVVLGAGVGLAVGRHFASTPPDGGSGMTTTNAVFDAPSPEGNEYLDVVSEM
eukprot:m.424822 g.424822  ORF g.424822 m.424822 type:complete len:534 (-) comp48971_c0_seq1:138-1739(-)